MHFNLKNLVIHLSGCCICAFLKLKKKRLTQISLLSEIRVGFLLPSCLKNSLKCELISRLVS